MSFSSLLVFHCSFKPLAKKVALVALSGALVAGCTHNKRSIGTHMRTASTVASVDTLSQSQLMKAADYWGKRYEKNPKDLGAALNYGTILRSLNRTEQSVAVLRRAVIAHPKNKSALSAYAKALVANGNLAEALKVIEKAHSADRPDWKLYSAQGTIYDQLGRHSEARTYYDKALVIQPGEPSILSNLAMSYTLTGQLKEAERTLQGAVQNPAASPRVRANLALVVALQGRFDEAESIARKDLPPEQAEANIAYLRKMMKQSDRWSELKGVDKKTTKAHAKPQALPGSKAQLKKSS